MTIPWPVGPLLFYVGLAGKILPTQHGWLPLLSKVFCYDALFYHHMPFVTVLSYKNTSSG